MSYDGKCYWLAMQFLEDDGGTHEDISNLAQRIQDTIEEFIEERKGD